MNLAADDPLDRQLHQTVVQEDSVTALYDARQVLEAHRHALRRAQGLFYSPDEALAGMQLHGLGFDSADADLWPGEVAVREVKPRDV